MNVPTFAKFLRLAVVISQVILLISQMGKSALGAIVINDWSSGNLFGVENFVAGTANRRPQTLPQFSGVPFESSGRGKLFTLLNRNFIFQ